MVLVTQSGTAAVRNYPPWVDDLPVMPFGWPRPPLCPCGYSEAQLKVLEAGRAAGEPSAGYTPDPGRVKGLADELANVTDSITKSGEKDKAAAATATATPTPTTAEQWRPVLNDKGDFVTPPPGMPKYTSSASNVVLDARGDIASVGKRPAPPPPLPTVVLDARGDIITLPSKKAKPVKSKASPSTDDICITPESAIHIQLVGPGDTGGRPRTFAPCVEILFADNRNNIAISVPRIAVSD